jgi:hypothetical protein
MFCTIYCGRQRLQIRRHRLELLESRQMLSTSGVPGDANDDGIVNGLDIADVSSNWLQTGPQPLAGDANADGVVNGLDIADIASHWLDTVPPPSVTVPAGLLTVNQNLDLPISGVSVADNFLSSSASTVCLTLAAGYGTLNVSTSVSGGVATAQVSQNSTGMVTIIATVAAINATLAAPNGVLYTPLSSHSGGDTLTATINDLGNTVWGTPQTASQGMEINVIGPPSVTVPAGLLTVNQNLDLPISGVSVADNFLSSSASTVCLTLAAGYGTLNVSTSVSGGVATAQVSQNSTGMVTITATVAAINATLAAPNGVLYTPLSSHSGADTLTATINDLGNTSSGVSQTASRRMEINVIGPLTVTVPVSPLVVNEGGTVAVIGTAVADTELLIIDDNVQLTLAVGQGDLLVSTAVSAGVTSAQVSGNGTANVIITAPLSAINATLANANSLIYTPTNGYAGTDTLTATINDLGNNSSSVPHVASQNVQISVIGPPIVAVPAGPLTIKQTLDLPISGVSIADGSLVSDGSTVELTFAAGHGTLNVSTSVYGGVASAQVSQNSTGMVTITATVAAINATLAAPNGVLYTPLSGYSGADSLSATISDLGNTSSGIQQTASHSVQINVTTGDVLPTDVPGLQLWLDPSDLSTLDLRSSAYLVGASQQYLYRSGGTNEFSFATHSKFSFAGWVYFNEEPGDTFDSSQVIFAKADTGGAAGVFQLSLTGSGFDSHLAFGVWSGAGAINYKSVTTAAGPGGSPFESGREYFIAVKFDGSQATDGGKLSIWVDGSLLPLQAPNGTVLPSTLVNDTAASDQLMLGDAFNASSMSVRMDDWGVWDNVAFSSTDVNSLWNGGAGLTITAPGELPNDSGLGGSNLTSPTMYWRLDEGSGTRYDLSGNGWNLQPSSSDGSVVGNKLQVISWTDKSGVLGTFYAGDGPQAVFHAKRLREPTYDPNAFGPGMPGVVFCQNQWLYNGVSGWMENAATGSIFQNVLVESSLTQNEDFFLSSSADTASSLGTERTFMPGYIGPSNDGVANVYSAELRINDTSGNSTGIGNGTPRGAIVTVNYGAREAFPGNVYMSPGQLMSFEWSCANEVTPTSPGGTGLAPGPWQYYVNGSQQQVYVSDGGSSNMQGDWTELVSGRSCQILNGFYDNGHYQSFTEVGATTTYGDVVAYGVASSQTDSAQMRSVMMQRVGLAGLLSPITQAVNTTATTYVTSSVVSCAGTASALVLPPVVACKGEQVVIDNGGSGAAVVNADWGSDIIPAGTTTGVSSLSISTGQNATLVSDGTNWNITALNVPAGNASQDGVVNGLAIIQVASNWLQTGGRVGDVNGDGVVNGLDIAAIASKYPGMLPPSLGGGAILAASVSSAVGADVAGGGPGNGSGNSLVAAAEVLPPATVHPALTGGVSAAPGASLSQRLALSQFDASARQFNTPQTADRMAFFLGRTMASPSAPAVDRLMWQHGGAGDGTKKGYCRAREER